MRISKDNIRLEAYGTIDELNSLIGLLLVDLKSDNLKKLLIKIQYQLFELGADLAAPEDLLNKKLNVERIPDSYITYLEGEIDKFESKLEPLKNFILPGGGRSASLLQFARTICRRAERRCVALKNREKINNNIIIFLNRLSDLLFVLSRFENKIADVNDIKWKPNH